MKQSDKYVFKMRVFRWNFSYLRGTEAYLASHLWFQDPKIRMKITNEWLLRLLVVQKYRISFLNWILIRSNCMRHGRIILASIFLPLNIRKSIRFRLKVKVSVKLKRETNILSDSVNTWKTPNKFTFTQTYSNNTKLIPITAWIAQLLQSHFQNKGELPKCPLFQNNSQICPVFRKIIPKLPRFSFLPV